jgi:hypothetical protein
VAPAAPEVDPGAASAFTPEWRGGVAPAAVEVNPGAGGLGLGSEKGALTKGFHPLSAEKRLTKLGVHRPSLWRGEGEWRPLLLKSTPGKGPWARLGKRCADQRLSLIQC